jgi:hypothetical protein
MQGQEIKPLEKGRVRLRNRLDKTVSKELVGLNSFPEVVRKSSKE